MKKTELLNKIMLLEREVEINKRIADTYKELMWSFQRLNSKLYHESVVQRIIREIKSQVQVIYYTFKHRT